MNNLIEFPKSDILYGIYRIELFLLFELMQKNPRSFSKEQHSNIKKHMNHVAGMTFKKPRRWFRKELADET